MQVMLLVAISFPSTFLGFGSKFKVAPYHDVSQMDIKSLAVYTLDMFASCIVW